MAQPIRVPSLEFLHASCSNIYRSKFHDELHVDDFQTFHTTDHPSSCSKVHVDHHPDGFISDVIDDHSLNIQDPSLLTPSHCVSKAYTSKLDVYIPHVPNNKNNKNANLESHLALPSNVYPMDSPPQVSPISYSLLSLNNNNNVLTTDSESSVVNLSSANLTAPMLSLLSKGLNFCPTPGEPDPYELRQYLDKFHAGLRRKQFFSKKSDLDNQSSVEFNTSSSFTSLYRTDGPFDHPKFKNPSKWNPLGPPNLESMIIFNEHHLNEYIPRAPPQHNLTHPEREALEQLQTLQDIIIKPADKGSAVVIQNKSDYIREGLRQLNDDKFYIEVPQDLTNKHNSDVHTIVDKLKTNNEISQKCADYLCIQQPRTPQLYLLPKIHKNQTPVPGRPIVSANSSPTERISQFVDYFLQPLVSTTKSYVKDTTDFINKIESLPQASPHTILATIDVSSLYTNIPNTEGITACKSFLTKHRPGENTPHNNSIAQLLEYVLTKNNFDFNAKHYLQVGGTAMGTKVAPSLANLFMADFEEKFVYTYHLQPSIWLRYIDDIFLLWNHGQEELDLFLNHLNTCHATIKFTSELSSVSVNFLDTTVLIDDNSKLYTTLYCKPTDSHNYLAYDSAHPMHTKNSLPYSQLLRVRRICHKLDDYDSNAVTLGHHFIRRGYPSSQVEDDIIRVRRLDRNSILQPATNTDTNPNMDNLFLIDKFTPSDNVLKNVVQKNWSLLGRTNTTTPLYNNRIIFGHKRNTNLRDILVHAKLPQTNNVKHRDNPECPLHICSTNNCRYCPRLDRTGRITSHTTGRSYNTRKYVSCKSNNLIYCITCTSCNKQYVGQTKKRLQERFVTHFYNIEGSKRKTTKSKPSSMRNNKFDDPIGRHFKLPNHNGLNSIHIHILQFISAPSDSVPGQTLRDEWERKWIHRLKTISPQGLNLAD